jgi:DNA-binding NarL/FixJ family response regulator
MYRTLRPDVTLMDLNLPDLSGIETMIAIWAEFPSARFIVLTTFAGDADITRALAAGARGYLLKSMHPDLMLEAIRQVHAGRKHLAPEIVAQVAEHLSDERLTARELEVLRFVVQGNQNKNIAEKMFLSEHTVKVHVRNLMGKLGASDRTEAVAIAARRGIIHL